MNYFYTLNFTFEILTILQLDDIKYIFLHCALSNLFIYA